MVRQISSLFLFSWKPSQCPFHHKLTSRHLVKLDLKRRSQVLKRKYEAKFGSIEHQLVDLKREGRCCVLPVILYFL